MEREEKALSLCIRVVVVSDAVLSGIEVDVSGELAVKILKEKGLRVSSKDVIGNSYRDILRVLRNSGERVVLLLGGTGPSPRDITVDVVESTAWRCLPGFGELFRSLSYREIGPKAILSRASLCILHDGKVVAVLPGSPGGVRLGLELLTSTLEHLIEEVDRFEGPHRKM